MVKYLLPIACPKCGIFSVQESSKEGEIEVVCGECPPFKTTINRDNAYIFAGYWRGLCPNCNAHIGTNVMLKDNIQNGFCGECFKLFDLKKGVKFEVKDEKDNIIEVDKEKERRYMAIYGESSSS